MKLSEVLSDTNISNMIELSEIAKDKFGSDYYSSCVKRNLKNGYDGEIKTKSGKTISIKVKHDGKLTIISHKEVKAR